MKLFVVCLLVLLAASTFAQAPTETAQVKGLEKFHPRKAPEPAELMLRPGDRLAICGDSITEQKMYSRIIEDYLTMCVPELRVSVRQYGWSGEKAPGFLARMTNDCLRFEPTIATTCYGMNDHEYRPYEERIGETYREKSTAIIEAFKANGARVIQGSPGCVGKMPAWVKTASGTVEDLNLNLCNLRNIGIELAQKEDVGFADVFWPMLTAGVAAQERYGTNFAIAGKDGVHPGWAGQTVMAYAFLKAMGLKGDIATISVDVAKNKCEVSKGHTLVSSKKGQYEIRSSHYPFCVCVATTNFHATYPICATDEGNNDSSIRAAMTLVPFDKDLNRFLLVATNGKASNYRVGWGGQTKTFSKAQLAGGVNLAEEFLSNPFSDAFSKVDAAVAAKQTYETRQIKLMFHGPEGKTNIVAVVDRTEKERAPLAEAITSAFVPVTHTLTIQAE